MMKFCVESNSFAFAQAENFKTYSRFVLNRQILRPSVGICFSNLLNWFGFPCSSSERLDLIGRIELPCPASTVALPYMLFEDEGGAGLSQLPDVFPSAYRSCRAQIKNRAFGWVDRIRTCECSGQSAMPFLLATTQYLWLLFVSLPMGNQSTAL